MNGGRRLLVVRHAPAEDRLAWARAGGEEAARPLTPRGRRRMERAARGLRVVLPTVDLLATSPYARAVETAEILAAAYDDEPRLAQTKLLAPGGSRTDLLAWLGRRRANMVAVVGHEPDLGHLVSWLVAGTQASFVPLKKGGACLVEFPEDLVAGGGTLCWALPPAVLRRLGR